MTEQEFKDRIETLLNREYAPYTIGDTLWYGEATSVAGAILLDVFPSVLDSINTQHTVTAEIIQQNEVGENYYETFMILKITKTPYKKQPIVVYVKLYGHYQSHDGSYFDGWKFVEPTKKTVEVYE